MKITRFRKGNVVRSGKNAVLVTGPGDKSLGYPVFAGVVIMDTRQPDDDHTWPVGMYSDTWSTGAFEKVDIKLSRIVSEHIDHTAAAQNREG